MINNKNRWSYTFRVTGTYAFEDTERPEMLDYITIRLEKVRNPKGDMVYMGDCFPFVDTKKYSGGISSWGIDKVKVINDILQYMVQYGLIIGEDIIVTEEDLYES